MRAVVMNQDPGSVDAVMGISSEMAAAVNDHAFPTGGGESLGDHQPGKAGSDDEEVGGWVCAQWPIHAGGVVALGRSFRNGENPG